MCNENNVQHEEQERPAQWDPQPGVQNEELACGLLYVGRCDVAALERDNDRCEERANENRNDQHEMTDDDAHDP